MNKTVVVSVLIVSVAALAGYYLYLESRKRQIENERYSMTGTSGSIAYVLDKQTGKSWLLLAGEKTPHETDDSAAKPVPVMKEVPTSDLPKLTGNAEFSRGAFSGEIYNGSDWVVREITFRISAVRSNGETVWTREFRSETRISSLTSTKVYFSLPGTEGVQARWGIVAARGSPPDKATP